jgi:hypothetical protein
VFSRDKSYSTLVKDPKISCTTFPLNAQLGTRNFFLSPQSQFPRLEGSTSAIAIPQLFNEMFNRNSAIAIFSEVRN